MNLNNLFKTTVLHTYAISVWGMNFPCVRYTILIQLLVRIIFNYISIYAYMFIYTISLQIILQKFGILKSLPQIQCVTILYIYMSNTVRFICGCGCTEIDV